MSLPSHYLITPAAGDEAPFLAALERSLQAGTRLLQLKGKGMTPEAYAALAQKVIALAHRYDCRVLLSGEPALVLQLGADGLHLDSKALKGATARPLPDDYLVAVSGHDLAALQQGEALGASLAVLSPVNYTSAHPDTAPLGWGGFAEIVSQVTMPVYALGGVSAGDEAAALAAGGQGVAGNKGYWKD
jgi:8-oxo-dGTP diphosphatase